MIEYYTFKHRGADDEYSRNDDGLARLLEHYSNISVVGKKSCPDVAHKYDNVGRCDGNLSLRSHLLEYSIVALRLYTTCIYQKKAMIIPLSIRINSVTGNTGSVLYYGSALSNFIVFTC